MVLATAHEPFSHPDWVFEKGGIKAALEALEGERAIEMPSSPDEKRDIGEAAE